MGLEAKHLGAEDVVSEDGGSLVRAECLSDRPFCCVGSRVRCLAIVEAQALFVQLASSRGLEVRGLRLAALEGALNAQYLGIADALCIQFFQNRARFSSCLLSLRRIFQNLLVRELLRAGWQNGKGEQDDR